MNIITGTRSSASSSKSIHFTRHVRELFIFLVVVVTVINLSSLFIVERIVQQEDHRLVRHLNSAINAVKEAWGNKPSRSDPGIDLAEFARTRHIEHLGLAVFLPDTTGVKAWHYLAATTGRNTGREWDSVSARAPGYIGTGWRIDGRYWRVITRADSWRGVPVVVSAGTPAPFLASLKAQLRREGWSRALFLVIFGVFAVLFYRLVLLPFRDMRRRAGELAASGILSGDTAQAEDDPEYVMGTFDVMVRRLVRQTEELQQRAATSERRARHLERFNEYMLTSMTTGMIIVGADGTILRLNRSAETILKLDGRAVIGRPYDEAGFYPEMVAIIEEGLKHGYVYSRREVRVEHTGADGPCYLGINTSRIRDDQDTVVGLSVLLTDLTEIKRLYDDLAENQRLADLGEMAAGLAHQLRNSIAAIVGYGRLLRTGLEDSDPNSEWVEAILTEVNETAEMVSRFLDFARPLRSERCPIDIRDVLGEALDTTAARAIAMGVRIAGPETGTDAPMVVLGDALLLKQVFVNLIQNALDAMEEGGAITIGMEIQTASPPQRPQLRILVSDTGSGIAAENQSRIFHPFFTSKESGTGLGLPLAKKIIIAHGGNLTLERSGPDGTVFAVTLPAEPPESLTPDGVPQETAGERAAVEH